MTLQCQVGPLNIGGRKHLEQTSMTASCPSGVLPSVLHQGQVLPSTGNSCDKCPVQKGLALGQASGMCGRPGFLADLLHHRLHSHRQGTPLTNSSQRSSLMCGKIVWPITSLEAWGQLTPLIILLCFDLKQLSTNTIKMYQYLCSAIPWILYVWVIVCVSACPIQCPQLFWIPKQQSFEWKNELQVVVLYLSCFPLCLLLFSLSQSVSQTYCDIRLQCFQINTL